MKTIEEFIAERDSQPTLTDADRADIRGDLESLSVNAVITLRAERRMEAWKLRKRLVYMEAEIALATDILGID